MNVPAAAVIDYSGSVVALTDDSLSGAGRDGRGNLLGDTAAKVAQQQTGNTAGRGKISLESIVSFHHHAENEIAVLSPGTGWEYGTNADNVLFGITFFWRERLALSSELNFP